jgi:hypothetical protein
MKKYQSLKNNWKINEDIGFVPDQIKNRVDSEDNYTYCKGFPLIKCEDIKNNSEWRSLLKWKLLNKYS